MRGFLFLVAVLSPAALRAQDPGRIEVETYSLPNGLTVVLALGFYITPALLGGLRDQMISQLIVQQIQQRLDWGFGTAMGVLLVAITLAFLFAASRAVRLQDVFGSGIGED